MFDLDGFKHYNDTFGHPAGDVLLTRLGANLAKYLGNRGKVFRMGGDEFCALFEPRLEDRVTLLDGAALALSEQGEGFWIGCSYGAISLPIEATDADEALRIADQRMYAQKNAGRASASRQVKEALLGVLAARDPELTPPRPRRRRPRRGHRPQPRASARRSARPPASPPSCTRPAGSCSPSSPAPQTATIALAGERIIAAAPALAHAARVVGTLHEHWDGSGYPDGLAGEAIPLGARIVAVADAYDALTSDRPARAAISHADALEELRARRGHPLRPVRGRGARRRDPRRWRRAAPRPPEL